MGVSVLSSISPSVRPASESEGSLDLAPDFELFDQSAKRFRLSENLCIGGVVVVFYRGHWCPYCRRYLCKLQANLARLTAGGAKVVAISPEPPPTSLFLANELGLQFPLLSDGDGRVIESYGTRNGFLGTGSVLPHASVFVINQDRSIRFRSIDRNYKKRTTVRTILGVLAVNRDAERSVLASDER